MVDQKRTKRSRGPGQRVWAGHAVYVALGARLAGSIRAVRDHPTQIAARPARRSIARRIDTLDHQRQKAKADKLAEVVAMWQRRVEWWNAEFKYAKDFKWKGEQGGQGGVDSRRCA